METDNNKKFKNRLNHFTLWCKNWYKTTEDKEDIFVSARRALYMDGYVFCKSDADVLSIVTVFLDDYNDWLIKHGKTPVNYHMRLHVFVSEIDKYMQTYGCDYHHALMHVFRNIFAFHIQTETITIEKPVYDRKLFKQGFVGSKKPGVTYKTLNKDAEKIFK